MKETRVFIMIMYCMYLVIIIYGEFLVQILGIAVAKGQLSRSVQSRLACCNILGKIATKFEPFV